MNVLRAGLALVTLLAFAAASSPAAEPKAGRWDNWRGPSSLGSTPSGKFAATFTAEKNLAWKKTLPGRGCSTPIVWDGKIIVLCGADGKDTVALYDLAGELKWTKAVGAAKRGKHRNGSASNSSPVVDADGIYVYFKSGNVAELDFEGNIRWSTNLQERFGKDTLYWDIGSSPVLTKDFVVLTVMQEQGSYLAAFRKKSGELAWKAARNYECPVEGDHAYTTPIVIEEGGQERIVVWGAEHVTSHETKAGKIVWSCAGFNPEGKRNWVAVSSHVIVGDMVVVPYGRGSRLHGIRLGGKGDVTKTHRAWKREDTGSFVPTPSAAAGKVYLLRDKGEVECIDPQSGKTLWQNRMPKHRAKYYGSPLVAGDKMYAPREDGVICVARLGENFEVIAENNMGEQVIASPVPLADGRLLVRGETHLFCIAAP